jgi:hypothetical protein
MHVLLLAAFLCGEEAAATGRTLVGPTVVELVDQLRTKGLEGGGGQGYAGCRDGWWNGQLRCYCLRLLRREYALQ